MTFEYKKENFNKQSSNHWKEKIEQIRELKKAIADLALTTKECYFWLGKMPKSIEMGYIYLLILNCNNEKRFNVLGQVMVDFIDELSINPSDILGAFSIKNAQFYVKFCDEFYSTKTKKRLKQIINETYKKGYHYYQQEQKLKQKQEREKNKELLQKKDKELLKNIDELQKY